MIQCIPNQPINLCPSPMYGCFDGDKCEPITFAADDVITLQFRLSPDDAAPSIPTLDPDKWDPAQWHGIASSPSTSGLSLDRKILCMGQGSLTTAIYTDAYPDPPSATPLGIPMNISFTVHSLEEPFTIRAGGHEWEITQAGDYSFNFIVTTNAYDIQITVGPDGGQACIGPITSRLNTDAEVKVYRVIRDGDCAEYEEVAGYTVADQPWMFEFNTINDTVTFRLPVSGIPYGPDCFVIAVGPSGFTDIDSPGVMVSQQVRVENSCDNLMRIRACLDKPAMGLSPAAFDVRVRGHFARPRWEYEAVDQRNDNGTIERVLVDRRTVYELAIYNADASTHQFLSLLPLFDHVYVEGTEVVIDAEAYAPDYGQASLGCAGVALTARPKSELVRNRLCDVPGAGCGPDQGPLCTEPLAFFYGQLQEDGYYAGVSVYGLGGFDPGQVQWYVDGVLVHTENGPFPGSFNYGPMPIPSYEHQVWIVLTNRGDRRCDYRWDAPIEPFSCEGPGMITIDVAEVNEEAYVMAGTSSGYFTVRGPGGIQVIPSGNLYFFSPDEGGGGLGQYCVWPSDEDGTPSGQYELVRIVGPGVGFSAPDVPMSGSNPAIALNYVTNAEINLSGFPPLTYYDFLNSPNLTTIIGYDLSICVQFRALNCALNQTTVDDILVAAAATGNPISVNLSGGTNASPSAVGLAAAATIIGNGGSVTHN